MKVENDTNDPVDYDQSSGGGDDEERPAKGEGQQAAIENPEEGPCSGLLNRKGQSGSSRTFNPCGSPPWTIEFTDVRTGRTCVSEAFSNANATVTIASFNPCSVVVTNN